MKTQGVVSGSRSYSQQMEEPWLKPKNNQLQSASSPLPQPLSSFWKKRGKPFINNLELWSLDRNINRHNPRWHHLSCRLVFCVFQDRGPGSRDASFYKERNWAFSGWHSGVVWESGFKQGSPDFKILCLPSGQSSTPRLIHSHLNRGQRHNVYQGGAEWDYVTFNSLHLGFLIFIKGKW